jgi:hypothetical protein
MNPAVKDPKWRPHALLLGLAGRNDKANGHPCRSIFADGDHYLAVVAGHNDVIIFNRERVGAVWTA